MKFSRGDSVPPDPPNSVGLPSDPCTWKNVFWLGPPSDLLANSSDSQHLGNAVTQFHGCARRRTSIACVALESNITPNTRKRNHVINFGPEPRAYCTWSVTWTPKIRNLKISESEILVFLWFSEVLEGLESSGRLAGSISTYFRAYKSPWSRVMTKKPNRKIYSKFLG